jgi:hydroxymethylbilane synthase
MARTIRIGTRSSNLAMWQANLVASILKENGVESEIIKIESQGDIDLKQPIYEMGISGVFTKSLDIALLNQKIDIAVHSLKDVPTHLPKRIINLAVLERADSRDILKYKGEFDESLSHTIGTGSIRRKAQWLNKYPNHKIEALRGNVNTRLQKIEDNEHWSGAIFAKSGLERLDLQGDNFIDLDWMIPAPAQGAIVVQCREKDGITQSLKKILNHFHSEVTTTVERDFMNKIEAGCSSPIGGIAEVQGEEIHFTGLIISIDGTEKATVQQISHVKNYKKFGKECGIEMLMKHGKLVRKIKVDLENM